MSNLQTDETVERAIQYLSSKQCTNGGFCTYKMEYLEEPNPRDTFFAVSSFQLIGRDIPHRHQVKAYLHQVLGDLQTRLFSPDKILSQIHSKTPIVHSAYAFNYLYFPLYALYQMDELDLDESWLHILESLEIVLPEAIYPNESGANLPWLLRKVRTKKLGAIIGDRQQIIEFVLSLKNQGGFAIQPNIIDTYWSLALLKELDSSLSQMDDTRQFIQRLQVPQTGFTLTESGILTHIEVVYAGIFASLLLQMEIPYLDSAIQFVRICQMDRGGFARMPLGLPEIENTYRALKIMKTFYS
ncbi:MAG TPA: prenyltransferase [Oscillatoriales bacterium UBA8482]|nr:MAG: prenyltransferase [Oscillatoriales cyanobacterium CG2_30_40_61]HBW57316.1 prenyltransferase [Oscillatoriales bacterium UBA8482]